MVSSVRFRARQAASAPALDKVKQFALQHWQALFLGLVGVVIVGTIAWKLTHREPRKILPKPTDKDVASKVRQLDSQGLKELLDKGGNANAKMNDVPALIVAIVNATLFYEGGKKTFDCLMSFGADVNAADKEKRTPLHCAIIQCQSTKDSMYFIRELVKKADLNAKDSFGKAPVHYAKNLSVFDELVKAGTVLDAEAEQWRKEMKRSELMRQIREHSKAG